MKVWTIAAGDVRANQQVDILWTIFRVGKTVRNRLLCQIDGEFGLSSHTPGVDACELFQWEIHRLTAILQNLSGGDNFRRQVDANALDDRVAPGR